ncbi:MAG: hypothetical protein HY713_11945 [candidate division NC10 bacterium]|nr:hypothetical protein [candidate division NC10 bacterium]
MMNSTLSAEEILKALGTVTTPGFSRDVAKRVRLAAVAAAEAIPELTVR